MKGRRTPAFDYCFSAQRMVFDKRGRPFPLLHVIRTKRSFPPSTLLMHTILIVVGLLLSLANLRADDFILSYWCGPTEDQDLDARHAEIAECGFTYAMPPCAGLSPASAKKSLEACKKYGLKYMLNDSRLMQFEPGHPAFKTNLDAMITEYAGHKALGGYHITDEPGP